MYVPINIREEDIVSLGMMQMVVGPTRGEKKRAPLNKDGSTTRGKTWNK